jgi:hypothetical protein
MMEDEPAWPIFLKELGLFLGWGGNSSPSAAQTR